MSWKTVYFHYDDDALAVFANVGLLRRARKDIGNEKVIPIDLTNGSFNSDGQQVKLDEQGVQQATCDCTASGCCKHILAAILWLQANISDDISALNKPLQDNHAQIPVEPVPLLHELLALETGSLVKQNSKADCRLAIRLLQAWDNIELRTDDQCTQFKIFLPDYEEPIIYLRGNGFQGMLSSLPERQKKALHLAAMAKLFTQQNQQWLWPDDLVVATETKQTLNNDDKAVIESIQIFIQNMLRQGLSHISQSSAAQLQLLNMSARAEGLPRLGNYLKRLSSQVKLLANKHFTMDEGQVLRLIARISAYLYQLLHANEDQLILLRGRVRQQYEGKNTTLNLMPIDAQWWQTQSGAIGATFSFWDTKDKKVIQTTQARANRLDANFNRTNVWQTLAIWKQTADNLMRNSFELHEPRLSDEGKLAASGESYALNHSNKFIAIADYQQLQTEYGFSEWPNAVEYLSNLQEDNIYEPVLLHIDSYEQLYWNETEQCILWAISDKNHNTAFLRLNWQGNESNKIEELRFITKQKLPIAAIAVQIVYHQQEIQLVPKTLWFKKEKGVELFYLDFEFIPRKKKPSNFINHILEYMAKKQHTSANFIPVPTLTQQLTRPIFSVIETQACTGRQQLSQSQKNELIYVVGTLRELGMEWFAKQVECFANSLDQESEALLKLVYLCEQFERSQMPLPFDIH
ncbi:MAG TPA: hypothetical protein DD649_03895 [Providencia sp.]|uniref:SWIM zinc finger family protein n=1 Tax=Providencia sp. TaxID=589 RepID=UPI000E89C13E|nr:SWIM zinc finger family protein [Providencia sp.]HBO22019.1 hypothetical protein [Providencia sp.]